MHCTTPSYNIAENGFYNTPASAGLGNRGVVPIPLTGAITALQNAVRDVSNSARNVLCQLVQCAKVYNLAEPVFPRVVTLQKWLGCSESTIRRALRELVDAGYIVRQLQGRKSYGRLATVRTILTHRVAALTGLSYNPSTCGQRSLFSKMAEEDCHISPFETGISGSYDSAEDQRYAQESPASITPRRPINPVPHDKFVAVQQGGAHASIPEDLVFLLDKGAHVFQVCRWMARAREAAWKLSDLVQLRREKILSAENPVGYLVSLLKAAERGEKITQYKAWGDVGPGEEDRAAANARKYLLDQETAMKRYGDTLVEWSSSGGPRWIKTGKDQQEGLVYMADPRADTAARPIQTMSVVALDNYVHDGSAKVVHEYRQASGEEMSKGFGFIKRMLKGAGNVDRRN
ncbi:hypothetical protein C3R74_11400 [Acidithiobacillus ferridurans]|uniref:helix-turn-helix domain-containing protein n=1 Tax=Acidithiobacillus ferridurans TaxID=1232575 RepID=UPI000DE1D4A2|nr:helix-turn-helix domain-containing protein [Acidithiobacillus ferridurans]RBL99118.1 hypothetical protein C3R74_11400 [Acidithiobacillus ferridurans]